MCTGISITVGSSDRLRLEGVVKERNFAQKHVWRAAIILLSAEGVGTHEIMRRTGTSKTCVWRWQERFMEEGVDGLLRDKTRPSRIPSLGPEVAERVVALTLTDPPVEATHWTAAMMATATGISESAVRRIWRSHGLQPHRYRQFKLSNDPNFVRKLRDVVGLYVDPPAHAIVLSVDEKSQIQALDRHKRFVFHFTPTSCSWLNAVEGFFAKLAKRRLKRGVFYSLVDLQAAINRFVAETNKNPKSFSWTADPDRIIAAVKRGHQALDSFH